jgi:uncharacterized protein YqeY
MIGGHKERTNLLRTIIGEIDRDKERRISDEFVISVIKKMVKNAKIMSNDNEIAILSEYLPKALTEAEVIKIVEDMVSENSYTQRDMGTFMKEIKYKHPAIDMKLVSMTFKKSL